MGLPMQVVTPGFGFAICDYQGGQRRIDTMLVGDVAPGDWLLVFIDAAREIIPEVDALKIRDALCALEAVMAGSGDVDHLFADIIENAARRKDAS